MTSSYVEIKDKTYKLLVSEGIYSQIICSTFENTKVCAKISQDKEKMTTSQDLFSERIEY